MVFSFTNRFDRCQFVLYRFPWIERLQWKVVDNCIVHQSDTTIELVELLAIRTLLQESYQSAKRFNKRSTVNAATGSALIIAPRI